MFIRRGFTLVEILLVIVVIGILAAVIVPRMVTGAAEAKKAACTANIAGLNSLVEAYHVEVGGWPADPAALVSAGYIAEAPVCPFAVAYTFDGTTHHVVTSTHNH